jgi:DNA-binding NtrC family response regulator
MRAVETVDDSWSGRRSGQDPEGPPAPGLVLVFSGGVPCSGVLPLQKGALEIGREGPLADLIDDTRMSRRHARVSFDGGAWTVRDLGSRNGTAVDGEEISGEHAGEQLRVLRAGSSIFLLAADVNPARAGVRMQGGTVMGPALTRAWQAIARAARCGTTLHLRGESGSGKELAARAFHAAGPRCAGPFIAVNCAAIPEGLAERLLFGARRGAYSGAVEDAVGTVQSAHGGTLFLDEIAELDPTVQAKLLRVLETREVVPLGASRPQPVDVAICSATHKDLRAEVAGGRLREDLYFRIARPEVVVPPLRARLEEMPWLIDRELRRVAAAAGIDPEALRPHTSLVEACLLRPWPGNVRELAAEISAAAQEAMNTQSAQVKAEHLSPTAGVGFETATQAGTSSAPPPSSDPLDRPAIEVALRRARGNISSAARALGLHRTQLRRLMTRYGIASQRSGIEAAGGRADTPGDTEGETG